MCLLSSRHFLFIIHTTQRRIYSCLTSSEKNQLCIHNTPSTFDCRKHDLDLFISLLKIRIGQKVDLHNEKRDPAKHGYANESKYLSKQIITSSTLVIVLPLILITLLRLIALLVLTNMGIVWGMYNHLHIGVKTNMWHM